MKTRMLSAVGLLALVLAGPAAAITVDDVIGLTRASASDAVIMAKIDSDGTVFRLTVDEILELKSAGVSDPVITYMINTGKLDVSEEQTVEQAPPQTEIQSAPESEPVYDDGPDGQFGMSVGVSNAGFGLSFGYYYPNWPGYWYGYYYDPFYWTYWPYYYSYYPPYPYHYWYYDPWYSCYPYPHDYYDYCYGDGGYYYSDYYRVDKGRNVGNRGPVAGGDRVIKEPGAPGSASRSSAQQVRLRDPNPNVGEAVTVHRGKVLRPGQPEGGQKVKMSTSRSQARTQPGRATVTQRKGSRSERSYAPSPSRQKVTRGDAQKKAPQKQEARPAPSRSEAKDQGSRSSSNRSERSAPPSRSWNGGGSSRGGSSPGHSGSGGSRGSGGRSSGGSRSGKGG